MTSCRATSDTERLLQSLSICESGACLSKSVAAFRGKQLCQPSTCMLLLLAPNTEVI